MLSLKKIFISCILVLPYLAVFSQKADDTAISAMNRIEYRYFFKHLKYLASDELKGRDVGSEGFNMAANYVTEEFKKNGMLPFGDSETYFQKILFLKPSIVTSSIKFQVENNSKSLNGNYGKNVSLLVSAKSNNFNQKQSLVFVGYGNILPDDKINDYEGADVRGKTVIVAVGGPKSIKNRAFDDVLLKIQNAEKRGASGIILFYPKGRLFQNLIFRYVHGYLTKSTLYYADTSIHGSMSDVDLKLCVFAKISFIKDVFDLKGLRFSKELRNIESGRNMSKELGMTINCSYVANIEHVYSKNVISIIPGSDSTLKNEYVVIGAHLDHLGIGKKIKGDSIYNGMLDNASGVAATIAIGKAFSQLPVKPRRSTVFICYTAEEEGLLGSHYYASRNEIKNGKIVANLNLDMIANLFETKGIIPIGYLHSNLSDAVDYSASNLNLTIAASKSLDEDYLERGDQFSFIKKGIPSIFIIPGNTAVDPKINGLKRTNKWLMKYYHSPFDDLNQSYSDKAFLTAIKLNFLTLYYITNNMREIKWNSRSWLLDRYVLKEKK
ncbi:MAG: M28 family peptidase [Bacteroidales bacterium]|nr:M28 family peptidase [Bacteroidales bacterium]